MDVESRPKFDTQKRPLVLTERKQDGVKILTNLVANEVCHWIKADSTNTANQGSSHLGCEGNKGSDLTLTV